VARAVVLIGVARTGGRFPELTAVPGAVAAVRDWARAQGVPEDLVLTFTDTGPAGTPVTSGGVLAGIRGLVDRGDVEQLVVYFSGHGINTGNAEFWLLPGAPEDGSQAVNVSLTSWYAERLPVRHVVLVSDACRTAASTVQELSVQGVAVVPNLPPRGPAAAVDVFYACALGDPAYEVKDPAASGAAYQALFTTVLVRALRGDHPALVTGGDGAAPAYGLVQPWPLKRALPTLVAEQLAALHAPLDLAQTPDARLSSDPTVAWLSRLEPWPAVPAADAGAAGGADGTGGAGRADGAGGGGGGDAEGGGAEPEVFVPGGGSLAAPGAAEPEARTVGTVGRDGTDAVVAAAADRLAAGLAVGATAATAVPAGPGAGAVPAGPGAARTAGPGVAADDAGPELEVAAVPGPRVVVHGDRAVRIDQVTPTAAVVSLASGGCAVLPTLPGRITLATVEDGRLVDCALPRDPADPGAAPGPTHSAGRVDPASPAGLAGAAGPSGAVGPVARRALTAAWSRFGLCRDEDADDDPDLELDPLEAVYRAWALHDRGRRDAVAGLAGPDGPGARMFDVVLLASGPGAAGRWAGLLTPVPLLARGWALLPAAPRAVRDRALAFPTRLPSHWTLFAAADAPRVVAALAAAALDGPEESP
jgi:hypothetical protein